MNNDKPQQSMFNLDEFKRWMRNTEDASSPNKAEIFDKKSKLVGVNVEPKIEENRLLAKIKVEEGHPEELALEFSENGGTISDVVGKKFLIEVETGSFFIHRALVSRSD